MILLGYLAMIGLGLLPLAAYARFAGVEADHTFLLPAPWALVGAFLIGMAICLLVGHVLGLLRFEHLRSYQSGRTEIDTPLAAHRRPRRRRGSTARH